MELIALGRMQNGKCPGPVAFPTEFLKTFSDKLSPLWHNMFNESYSSDILPHSLQQVISLILKKDKDPSQCSK